MSDDKLSDATAQQWPAEPPEPISADPAAHQAWQPTTRVGTFCPECSWVEDGIWVPWPCSFAPEQVIRCVRCWEPLTDDDDLIRTPFAATGQPSVAHRACPEDDDA